MIRNTAGQTIGAQLINAADGSAFTGQVTVYVTGDAGTQAIGSVGSGLCTHEGNGFHTYRPAQEETAYALIAFTFIGSSAIPATVQVETTTEAAQSALQTASGSAAITALDLVQDALRELRVLNATDPASGEDAEYALRKLNRLLDGWNAERETLYATAITAYTLTPSLQPHTIGPNTATFTTTIRPVSIDGARLVIDGVAYPVAVHEGAWRLGVSTPDLESEFPTDLAYEPSWPNGAIYLYPIPAAAVSLELVTRVGLEALTLVDTFTLPPGYQDAIVLTLAEALAAPFRGEWTPDQTRQASQARARIFGNNAVSTPIVTRQAGMPGGGRSGFDAQGAGPFR